MSLIYISRLIVYNYAACIHAESVHLYVHTTAYLVSRLSVESERGAIRVFCIG